MDTQMSEATEALARAAVKAYAELNEIRARDGVPYKRGGLRSSVDADYFSAVVDELSDAVELVTGKPAHLHPLLYSDTAPRTAKD